jgi:putative restriction endonuclease
MELRKADDLFAISRGEEISKRNLFDLIQFSKVEGSSYWSGSESIIGNTPQQGINWVGQPPEVRAVIIKTRPGSYETDGWSDDHRTSYRYSFKARTGKISYTEIANKVLINQPRYLYPIFLFTEEKDGWRFEGNFSVTAIENAFVVLIRGSHATAALASTEGDGQYHEGERKYVTHLMAERNRDVVKVVKKLQEWICDVCGSDFLSRYGVTYIEAHHKVPISTYPSSYTVSPTDFVLLCPNCHKAVHIYMQRDALDYPEIRAKLRVLAPPGNESADEAVID